MREQQAHDRAGAGRNDDAGQQQARRCPAARAGGQRENEQARGERTDSRRRHRRQRRHPSMSASRAVTEAPPDTPSTYGSASGLRNSTCSSAPARASRPPTPKAVSARGSRRSTTTSRASDGSALESAAPDLAGRHVRAARASATASSRARRAPAESRRQERVEVLQGAPGVRRLGKASHRHKAVAAGCFVRTPPMWKNRAARDGTLHGE